MGREISVKLKLLKGRDRTLPLPSRQTEQSVGFDLFASNEKPITLKPGKRTIVPTGIAIELPSGFEAQIRPRSGLAYKYGLTILNSPGTIDPDYRGEIKVIVANFGEKKFVIKKGDRIAQMVFSKVVIPKLKEVEELKATKRNRGGFGHTGLNLHKGKKRANKG